MPLLLLPLVILAIVALTAVLVPISILQRYRAGTARRVARGWVALLNAGTLSISVVVFLVTALISSAWIPGALSSSALGLIAGCLLGWVGVRISHWELERGILHMTPNRCLVLSITLLVAARLAFGIWRAWHAWKWTPEGESWLAASGLAGSMAVGAVVIGYYFTFWIGVWIRTRAVRAGTA